MFNSLPNATDHVLVIGNNSGKQRLQVCLTLFLFIVLHSYCT